MSTPTDPDGLGDGRAARAATVRPRAGAARALPHPARSGARAAPAPSSSTRRSASAGTARRCCGASPTCASSVSTATRTRSSSPAAGWRRTPTARVLVHAVYDEMPQVLARGRLPAHRRHPVRPRRLLDAARRGGARLRLLPGRAARHADGSHARDHRRRRPQHLRAAGARARAARVRRGEVRASHRRLRRPRARPRQPFDTSARLVELIRDSIPAPARRTGGNPAKRTFQALRIEVNGELEVARARASPPRSTRSPSAVASSSCPTSRSRTGSSSARWCPAPRATCRSTCPFVPEGHEPELRLITRGSEKASDVRDRGEPARRLGAAARGRADAGGGMSATARAARRRVPASPAAHARPKAAARRAVRRCRRCRRPAPVRGRQRRLRARRRRACSSAGCCCSSCSTPRSPRARSRSARSHRSPARPRRAGAAARAAGRARGGAGVAAAAGRARSAWCPAQRPGVPAPRRRRGPRPPHARPRRRPRIADRRDARPPPAPRPSRTPADDGRARRRVTGSTAPSAAASRVATPPWPTPRRRPTAPSRRSRRAHRERAVTTLAPAARGRPAIAPAASDPAASYRPPVVERFRRGDHVRRLRVWQVGLLIVVHHRGRPGRRPAGRPGARPSPRPRPRTGMRTVVLPATRGDITDANGVPLATTVAARNVTVDQTLVKDAAAESRQPSRPCSAATPRRTRQRMTGDAPVRLPRQERHARRVGEGRRPQARRASSARPPRRASTRRARSRRTSSATCAPTAHGGSGPRVRLRRAARRRRRHAGLRELGARHRDPDGRARRAPTPSRAPACGSRSTATCSGWRRRRSRKQVDGGEGRQRHGRRDGPADRPDPRARHRAHVRPEPAGRGRARPTSATARSPTSSSPARRARS